jgi:hypothetical protein
MSDYAELKALQSVTEAAEAKVTRLEGALRLREEIAKLEKLCDHDCDNEDCVRCFHYPEILEQKRKQLAALTEGTPGVKVKPLVWEAITENVHETIGFNSVYQVRIGTDGVVRWQERYMGDWQSVDTIEAAKAAAQADYESRTLAALDLTPQPAPDVARLVEAAKAYVDAHDKAQFMRSADYHNDDCSCLRCHMDRLRDALAAMEGKP